MLRLLAAGRATTVPVAGLHAMKATSWAPVIAVGLGKASRLFAADDLEPAAAPADTSYRADRCTRGYRASR